MPTSLRASARVLRQTPRERRDCAPIAGRIAAVWGVGAVAAMLLQAALRLAPNAIEAFSAPLGPAGWAVAAATLAFMGYFEGYRGFQKGFSPRVVARAAHLARAPRRPLHVVLAPLYCMGLVHATRRRLISGWALVAMIVAIVVAVRGVAQPWRGLIDAGVVLGLAWGLVSLIAFSAAALAGGRPRIALDLPAS